MKMIKFKLFITTFMLLVLASTPISAKSLLTYFDTVVVESDTENTRESVLQNVLIIAESQKEDFAAHQESVNFEKTNLRDIMRASSDTFFQK